MTKLDILFYLLTELISVLTWHSHIAQHDIRLLSTHLLKSRICIETGYQAIVIREQQSHVVDNLCIIVDDEDGWTTIVVI